MAGGRGIEETTGVEETENKEENKKGVRLKAGFLFPMTPCVAIGIEFLYL